MRKCFKPKQSWALGWMPLSCFDGHINGNHSFGRMEVVVLLFVIINSKIQAMNFKRFWRKSCFFKKKETKETNYKNINCSKNCWRAGKLLREMKNTNRKHKFSEEILTVENSIQKFFCISFIQRKKWSAVSGLQLHQIIKLCVP